MTQSPLNIKKLLFNQLLNHDTFAIDAGESFKYMLVFRKIGIPLFEQKF